MSSLCKILMKQQWQVAITHIQSLADATSADQLFHQTKYGGFTAIMCACGRSAPLELYQLMITKAKVDSRKRCLLAITCSNYGCTPLHFAASSHSDPAVVELMIREHPLALCATSSGGDTPLQLATIYNRPTAIISLLTEATNALAASDYAALAARVHGDERALRCLALTPDRLAVRISLLLCIKHGYVYVRRSKRHRADEPDDALDTGLAFSLLNDNVWSHVMTFL